MLISQGQMFADMGAKEVRDVLRKVQSLSCAAWRRPDGLTDAAWKELCDERFVEPRDDGHILTVKGNAFANARIGKPITREKAEKILEGVLERAAEVNESGEATIHSIDVFGSYTTDAEKLGDIDLVVDVHVPWDPSRPMHENFRASDKVLVKLRNRSQYVSFCDRNGLPPNVELVRVFIGPSREEASR